MKEKENEKKKMEMQNSKLLKFAEHLKTIKSLPGQLFDETEVVDVFKKVRIHYKVMYHYLIFDELPAVFEEFEYNETTGDPILIGLDPKYGPTLSVVEFFGIGPEEFAHLFDMEGLQNTEKYGGKELNLNSTPSDIASNIMGLIRFRKMKNQPRLGK